MRIENMITQVKFYQECSLDSIDILKASPHYFYKKYMETQKENL